MTNKLQRRQSATIKLFALLVCRREEDGKFLMVDEGIYCIIKIIFISSISLFILKLKVSYKIVASYN